MVHFLIQGRMLLALLVLFPPGLLSPNTLLFLPLILLPLLVLISLIPNSVHSLTLVLLIVL